MARRKTHPDYVRVKSSLSERLKQIRTMLFGERGGPEMARRLNLPIRTWYNYESGVTVPAEVALKFVELTGVDPMWLLRGQGEPFRNRPAASRPDVEAEDAVSSVSDLLRQALQQLESRGGSTLNGHASSSLNGGDAEADVMVCGIDAEDERACSGKADGAAAGGDRPRYLVAQRDWMTEDVPFRCLLVEGDAMSPIVADGAFVAYSEQVEPLKSLDGQMVVAKIADHARPVVRWMQVSANLAILRAENRDVEPSPNLIEVEDTDEGHPFRRVLWISTPH